MLIDINFHIDFFSVDPGVALESAEQELSKLGVGHALAVDMPRINQHLAALDYVKMFDESKFFTAVPCLRVDSNQSFQEQLELLANNSVDVVKVHPRWLGLGYESDELRQIVATVRRLDMKMLLCAYPYTRSPGPSPSLHVPTCLERLSPDQGWPRTILMHGGGPQFLEVCEWSRNQESVLVDLSLTLTQFASSSIWFDMQNALERFEQRLVVGSDSPYEDLVLWKANLDRLLDGHDAGTIDRVRSENIRGFLHS